MKLNDKRNSLFIFFVLCVSIFTAITIIITSSNPSVNALPATDLNFFSMSNILYYDPENCGDNQNSNGIYMGQPFTGMTDELLKKFAAAGINENGRDGEAFELSLLANLYEKVRCKSSCPHTAQDLADYFKHGGWFGSTNATQTSFDQGSSVNNGPVTEQDLSIAKDVLVNGRRAAPQGIDEHDDVGDLVSVELDGKQVDKYDQNNYIRGRTVIHNRFSSTYTFFAWCDGSESKSGRTSSLCDPFGSTTGIEGESYSTVTPSNNNTMYNNEQALSDAQLQQVEKNKKVYQEAAKEYDMPWQILAALHYREFNLQVSNPANGQGIYQLYSYTGGGNNSNRFNPGPVDEAEFLRQTKLAAKILREKVGNVDLTQDDNVKRAFFHYNGTASIYKEKARCLGFNEEQANNGEGSPYVMNRYDAERDPTNAAMSHCWAGSYRGDNNYVAGATETRPGAFVIYEALGGGDGSSNECSSSISNIGELIAETALKLSWDGRGHDKHNPKPEYKSAMESIDNYVHPNGDPSIPAGASCDQFVATVMRYSKADEDFNLWNATGSGLYMSEHPEKYTEIKYDGTNPEILKPGDIFASTTSYASGHIWIYVEIDGEYGRADASFNNRTAEHYKTGTPAIQERVPYKVFRRTK